MDCPACGGAGCEHCGPTGRLQITDCPLCVVPEDAWQLLRLARLYEKGLPPVAGGALDQAAAFVEACDFVWNEEKYWKIKQGRIHE